MSANEEVNRQEEKKIHAMMVDDSLPDFSSRFTVVEQQPTVELCDAIPTAAMTATVWKGQGGPYAEFQAPAPKPVLSPPCNAEPYINPNSRSASSATKVELEDKKEEEDLRKENYLLRKENEELRVELQNQLENLKMISKETVPETTNLSRSTNGLTKIGDDVDESSRKIVNDACRHGQKPTYCDEAERAEAVRDEKRTGEVDQGSKISGERCFAEGGAEKASCSGPSTDFGHTLSPDAIRRYNRQLLVPSFGVAGQERLLKSSALVVGCGGLGSPVALYLAAAGVGCLGLVDHDLVELSNLHRQVIHTEAFVGKPKVKSAASACRGLNSSVPIIEYVHRLDAANAVEIVSKFDVVLDATDNLPTRYLLNDACVVTGKPLVSGAALGVEGQVTVYNHKNGPCYRCLFPIPPPQGARQRCSDNGVIGVVPGIIGTFQALEALKIASEVGEALNGRMLLLDALSTRVHMVKLRGRNVACIACGDAPKLSRSNLHEYDYESFTQSPLSDEAPERQHIIPETERLSSEELKIRLESGQAHVLLDVRDAHEYAISRLPNSVNIPYSTLKQNLQTLRIAVDDSLHSNSSTSSSVSPAIYIVCRRGNDSQRAVQLLRDEGFNTAVDVIGGLESWVRTVNKEFPFY